MNASISLLLDGIGAKNAEVFDYRESFEQAPFDISCVQRLIYPDTPALDPDVLYVADKIPAAEALAPIERCRVVCIPDYANAKELLNALVSAQREIDDLDMRLVWASLEKDSLGAMLPIVADVLNEPVLATDADDVLVAYAAPEGLEVRDEVFRHILAHNCILSDVPLYDTFLAAMPEGNELRDKAQLVSVPESGRQYLNAMVMNNGKSLINILMSNEGGEFSLDAADTMLRLKLIIEQAIRAGSPLGFPPPDHDSCVRRLLDHIFVRQEIIEGYLQKRGWGIDDRYYCVLAQTEGPIALTMLPFLARQMRGGILRNAVVLVHGAEVACVVHADECPYDVERLSTDLWITAARFSAKMGVSCPFHDFRELRRYYDSCRVAMTYGTQETPVRTVSFFEDYAARHLEKALFERSINEALLDTHVCDLNRYDDEQGSDLLHTLLVYLECGQSKTLASKRLFIHRNTLIYRLGTIGRVMGVDLESLGADRLFHMMYTCKFLLNKETGGASAR